MTARSYTYTVSDVASAAHVDFVEPEYTVRSRSTRRRLGEKKHVYKAISKGIGRTVVVSDDTRHIIELEIYYFNRDWSGRDHNSRQTASPAGITTRNSVLL